MEKCKTSDKIGVNSRYKYLKGGTELDTFKEALPQ